MGETLDREVLDLVCTETVSGKFWIEEYLSTLPEEWNKTFKTSNNISSKYCFGDGKESKAI